MTGVACSSSSSGDSGGDAGADGTDVDATQGGDSGNARDGASSDGGSGDGGSQDATSEVTGNCSPVKGACDIVLQNCGSGKECVVARASDGGFTTECIATNNNEHIPKGSPCCPGGQNPCLPGLECLGAACAGGDAAPTSRCAPHCCTGDDSVCGQSPEGYPGHCDTNVNSGGPNPVDLYQICTYAAVCKPFGIIPCPSASACEVLDNLGSAKCDNIYNPADGGPAGAKEGEPCKYLNQCADGMMCFGPVAGSSTCLILCLIPNSAPPFDAGADGAAFQGGCPQGKACGALDPNQFPSWLGACN